MPRQPRAAVDGGIYHVLNRGNCRMEIFGKEGDYQSFIKLLEEGRQRYSMRILGYCLMKNHWHMVLWPRLGTDLSRFVGWVSSTHVRRWREHRANVGEGHLYQGRFKGFLVQNDEHFLTVMRYIEANPLRAKLVEKAERWPWSSLGGAAGSEGKRIELSPWPVDKPRDWLARVNEPVEFKTLETLQKSVKRNRPFGDDRWVTRIAVRHGLESTLRDPWRPKKYPAEG